MDISTNNTNPEKVSLLQTDLRRTIITESVLFMIIGVTSFISLAFLPRDVIAYLIGAILYGSIQIITGSVGLYGSYKVFIRLILGYLVLLVAIALFNLGAIVVCFIFLIQHIVDGVPSCSQTCGLTRFVFVVVILYFILQAIVAAVLFIFSIISFKHTMIFYKKEKRFAS